MAMLVRGLAWLLVAVAASAADTALANAVRQRLVEAPLATPAAAFAQVGELLRSGAEPVADEMRLAALRWQLETLQGSAPPGPRSLQQLLAAHAAAERAGPKLHELWDRNVLRLVELRVIPSEREPPARQALLRVAPGLFATHLSPDGRARHFLVLELTNRAPVPLNLPGFGLRIGAPEEGLTAECTEWDDAPSDDPAMRPPSRQVPPGRGIGYMCSFEQSAPSIRARLRDAAAICAAGQCLVRTKHFADASQRSVLLAAIASADPPPLPGFAPQAPPAPVAKPKDPFDSPMRGWGGVIVAIVVTLALAHLRMGIRRGPGHRWADTLREAAVMLLVLAAVAGMAWLALHWLWNSAGMNTVEKAVFSVFLLGGAFLAGLLALAVFGGARRR